MAPIAKAAAVAVLAWVCAVAAAISICDQSDKEAVARSLRRERAFEFERALRRDELSEGASLLAREAASAPPADWSALAKGWAKAYRASAVLAGPDGESVVASYGPTDGAPGGMERTSQAGARATGGFAASATASAAPMAAVAAPAPADRLGRAFWICACALGLAACAVSARRRRRGLLPSAVAAAVVGAMMGSAWQAAAEEARIGSVAAAEARSDDARWIASVQRREASLPMFAASLRDWGSPGYARDARLAELGAQLGDMGAVALYGAESLPVAASAGAGGWGIKAEAPLAVARAAGARSIARSEARCGFLRDSCVAIALPVDAGLILVAFAPQPASRTNPYTSAEAGSISPLPAVAWCLSVGAAALLPLAWRRKERRGSR